MDRRRFLAGLAAAGAGMAVARPGWGRWVAPAHAAGAARRAREAGRCADDPVRALLIERLEKRGVETTFQGKTFLAPVGRVGGDDVVDAFFVEGRLLVPAKQQDLAARLLGPDAEASDRDGGLAVAEFLLRPGVPVLAAVRQLRGEGVDATPHHLFFSAPGLIIRVREGFDPEVALRPPGPDAGSLDVGAGTMVAVVDTGLAADLLSDPWLAGAVVERKDVDRLRTYERSLGTSYLDVAAGHGTLCAGIARQVAPGCDLAALRTLDTDGVVTEREAGRGLRRALALAGKERRVVLSCSWGGYTLDDAPPLALRRVVRLLTDRTVMVAAAGNECWSCPIWPAAFRSVVAVAALDAEGATSEDVPYLKRPAVVQLAAYSNDGGWVDTAAPGTWTSTFCYGRENPLIETDGRADRFQGYAIAGGTSFACASVSGAIAAAVEKAGGDLQAARQLVVAELNAW